MSDFAARHLNYRLVDDEQGLQGVEELLERRFEQGQLPRIAVDFEFAGYSESSLSLRLLQLGFEQSGPYPEEQLLLDASKVDVRPFAALFADSAVEKVVHAPHSDYQRWLEHNGANSDETCAQLAFANVYDVAQRLGLVYRALHSAGDERAALLLAWTGKKRLTSNYYGYAVKLSSLAEGALDVEWSPKKLHWSENWVPEILSERQLEAAALDVAALPHLRALLEPLEQELEARGVEISTEAAKLDDRVFGLSRDLALVPQPRREELRGLLAQFAVRAAESSGELVLPELGPAETRVLLREFSGPRTPSNAIPVTADVYEQDGLLVVRALTNQRRRELSQLAERIGRQQQSAPELQPLEELMVSRYLEKHYPGTAPVLEPA